MRDVESIHCSCGGNAEEVVPNEEEEKKYGCGSKWCCVTAFECEKCHTRFTVALNAPEME
jgi:hypothetical protein